MELNVCRYVILFCKPAELWLIWVAGKSLHSIVKSVETDLYQMSYYNLGPKANFNYSAVRIYMWLSCMVVPCLCQSSPQQFSLLPVRGIKYGDISEWLVTLSFICSWVWYMITYYFLLVWIPLGAWMFECCVLSGRGLCDKLIICPEESYRLWCVVMCDLENLKN
jgi:hypothetical protein